MSTLAGSVGGPSPSSHLDPADEALLQQMDEFFSVGANTERIRRFIEANDDALALVASEDGANTNSQEGLQLYQLFQQYASLIESVVEDFVRSQAKEKEADVVTFLVAAIKKEWDSSENAYRLLCTSYIAASLDYKAFLQFAEDLYGTTHFSMAADDEDLEEMDSSCSGSTCSCECEGEEEETDGKPD